MWTEEQRDRYRVERKRYPSDLTDAEWTQIEDLFASYESYSHTLRELVNACLYLSAEGCRWQSLPKDFPPSGTVRWWWDRFHREGVWERASARLVRLARLASGRTAAPSTGLIDSQSVRCGPQAGPRGTDGGKRVHGRKRHVLTCSIGLLLAVLVTAANLHDSRAATRPCSPAPPRPAGTSIASWGMTPMPANPSCRRPPAMAWSCRSPPSPRTAQVSPRSRCAGASRPLSGF
ncbi:MAG: transposase [Actinomycetota bacterium]|nr:transposase [Actinomycetota bacterium]